MVTYTILSKNTVKDMSRQQQNYHLVCISDGGILDMKALENVFR